MQIFTNTPAEYVEKLPAERREVMNQLRKTILDHLPDGFVEEMNYGMVGYVVPHSLYPNGYHCDPKLPLSFMGIASQKHYVAVYHMGIYASPSLHEWFVREYEKLGIGKLDMGKSCIRFKRMDTIPYALIGQLAGKMEVDDWITMYEEGRRMR